MNNRLMIAAVAFIALLGGLIYVVNQRADDEPDPESTEVPELPEISRDAITSVTITRPGDEGEEPESVTLSKVGEVWRVTAPIDADADTTAVDTVLDKLSEMEVQGIAATNPENHERLEVGSNGIRVEVKAGDEVIANLIIGAYRSRNTMVRVEGEDTVVTVPGSIKYAFNKDLKDWRNRRVANEDPASVIAARFESENGTFEFHRNAEDEWVQPEGAEEIERFGPTKVQSIVSSIARMRAVNFAAADVAREATGLDTPSGVVTLTIREGDAAETEGEGEGEGDGEGEGEGEGETEAGTAPTGRTVVLRVGAALGEDENGERYLVRDGDSTVYVISNYLADRMRPDADKFQAPEPGSEPEQPPGMMPGLPPGLPGLPPGHGPGGPGNPQIPPELMQKIQQQLQQQQGATMG